MDDPYKAAVKSVARDIRSLGSFLEQAAKRGDRDAVWNLLQDLHRVVAALDKIVG